LKRRGLGRVILGLVGDPSSGDSRDPEHPLGNLNEVFIDPNDPFDSVRTKQEAKRAVWLKAKNNLNPNPNPSPNFSPKPKPKPNSNPNPNPLWLKAKKKSLKRIEDEKVLGDLRIKRSWVIA